MLVFSRKEKVLMFRASWMSPYEGEVKTIVFRSSDGNGNNPLMCGLGYYRDVEGKLWDIKAIIGKQICARLVGDSSNPNYYSTSDDFESLGTTRSGLSLEEWIPWNVKIVRE
jgi:hypothetical protein